RAVTSAEKRSRSTANAPPAGTGVAAAARIQCEASRRLSSLSRPTAFDSAAPRNELEQTSSQKFSLTAAAVRFVGFCSSKRTRIPRSARLSAASEPARPAPMMVTTGVPALTARPQQQQPDAYLWVLP